MELQYLVTSTQVPPARNSPRKGGSVRTAAPSLAASGSPGEPRESAPLTPLPVLPPSQPTGSVALRREGIKKSALADRHVPHRQLRGVLWRRFRLASTACTGENAALLDAVDGNGASGGLLEREVIVMAAG